MPALEMVLLYCSHEACVRRLHWFGSISYEVGGQVLSSLDIEHGVLRSNSPSPAGPLVLLGLKQWAGPYFKDKDPRLKLVCCQHLLPVCVEPVLGMPL